VFNVPGDDLSTIVRRYRAALDALAGGERPDVEAVRQIFGGEFTRGHFARAV
jgi:putative protease